MSDIQLRFNKDMLVLSSPVEAELVRLGVDVPKDWAYTLMFEPELLEEAYKLEAMAGAQCAVAFTGRLTPLEAAKAGMRDAVSTMADNAIAAVSSTHPQHILAEVNPCGLPLDPSSKASLLENRDQYAEGAKTLAAKDVDAIFLNGFTGCADLKCALMGVRKVSDIPVFASVTLDEGGSLQKDASIHGASSGSGRTETAEEAAAVMAEYGADICGFATYASVDAAKDLLARMQSVASLPGLVQLCVREIAPEQEVPTPENLYFSADTMVDAADALRAAGAQFLRAAGVATPAYTGALVAATDRLDVVPVSEGTVSPVEAAVPDDIADRLRAKVSAAIGGSGVQ